jgi:hypothetical protein
MKPHRKTIAAGTTLLCVSCLCLLGWLLWAISEGDHWIIPMLNHMADFELYARPLRSNVVTLQHACPFSPPAASDYRQQNGGWFYTQAVVQREHVAFDPGFGAALSIFLGTASVYDIGAGVGQLAVCFHLLQSKVDYMGFDGGNNIESLWGRNWPVNGNSHHVIPSICWIDASLPISLPPRDWVISIEVGEHIPFPSESQFLDNLAQLSSKGVILSWAVPGQGGRWHVNERSNAYIIAQMGKRGLWYDDAITMALRRTVQAHLYLQKTLMVFRKEM